MVSLLEYRKRKRGSVRDPEPAGSSSSLGGTPTRPGSHYSKDSHHPHSQQQMQPTASPQSSFSSASSAAAAAASSSTHNASIPQIEEVSPPDHQGPSGKSRHQDSSNNQWMVPTTVERLREGKVLERVLRSIKMDRVYKRSDGSAEKESDADSYEIQSVSMASPMKSPHRYSPSVYPHQSTESHRQTDSPSFLQQTSNSPFRGSYSPSLGQSFYPRLPSAHPGQSQDQPPSSYTSPTPTSSSSSSSSDSRPPAGSLHQQGGGGNVDGGHGYGGSHLKASLLNSSGLMGAPSPGSRPHGQTKIDSDAQASRGSQQQASHGLMSGSPGQAALPAGSRMLSASGQTHYSQRGTSLSQFQHSPLQGSGVRTQSGGF